MPPSRSQVDAERVQALAAATLEDSEYRLVRMPEILHLNFTDGRPNQAVINLCDMAKIALEKGMVQARFRGDTGAAIATFMRGADAVVTPLEHILPRTHLASGGLELRAGHSSTRSSVACSRATGMRCRGSSRCCTALLCALMRPCTMA